MFGMKKALAIPLTIAGSLLLLLGAFLIINGVQRDQAYKTARTFVMQSEVSQLLSTKEPKRVSVTCHPEGSTYGKCQAVEYTVNRDLCIQLVQKFQPTNTDCNAEVDLAQGENKLKVIAGSLYGTDERQFQVIVNEPHLLSMWK